MNLADELRKIAEDFKKVAQELKLTDFSPAEIEKNWHYTNEGDQAFWNMSGEIESELGKHGLELLEIEESGGFYWRFASAGSVSTGDFTEEWKEQEEQEEEEWDTSWQTKFPERFKHMLKVVIEAYKRGIQDRKAGKPGVIDGLPIEKAEEERDDPYNVNYSMIGYIAGYRDRPFPEDEVLAFEEFREEKIKRNSGEWEELAKQIYKELNFKP